MWRSDGYLSQSLVTAGTGLLQDGKHGLTLTTYYRRMFTEKSHFTATLQSSRARGQCNILVFWIWTISYLPVCFCYLQSSAPKCSQTAPD